jgi:hypothetical protein
MTTVTIASRDKSRKRKLKQAQNDRFAQCEPAIRFWKRTGTMHKYASIVIEKTTSETLARAAEAYTISTWQPSLNMLFVKQHLDIGLTSQNKKKPAFKIPTIQHNLKPGRIWKTIGRRANTKNHKADMFMPFQLNPPVHEKHQAFIILFRLASQSTDTWFAQRLLLSPNTKPITLFALARLSKNIEEPFRSRATCKLKQVFKRRRIDFPPNPKSFIIPTLARASFEKETKTFIKQVIIKEKETYQISTSLTPPPCFPKTQQLPPSCIIGKT